MKSRRTLAVAVFGAALLALAGTALAVSSKGPAKAKVVIKGTESLVPNAYLKIGFHFDAGTVPIRSGGTVILTNLTKDGHTLSIVKASQVPRTISQLQNCSVCGAIAKSHGINFEGPPTEGPPPVLLVNVGAPGFDAPILSWSRAEFACHAQSAEVDPRRQPPVEATGRAPTPVCQLLNASRRL